MNTANLVSFKLQDNNLADSCWMYTWAHLTENDPCLVTGGTINKNITDCDFWWRSLWESEFS